MVRDKMATPEHLILRRNHNHKTERLKDHPPSPDRRGLRDEHKLFAARESRLTVLLAESPHIRAIYNIFVAIIATLFFNTVVYDFVESGKINVGWTTVVAGFGDPIRAAKLWLFQFSMALLAYPAVRIFAAGYSQVQHHTGLARAWCVFCCLGLLLLQGTLLAVPIRSLFNQHLAVASSVAVNCELFRFVMKIHSFVRAVTPRVLHPRAPHTPLPSFTHYLYFLFVPTLLYRDEYPRTKRIRWGVAATHFAEVVAIIFCNSFLWERFILPYWSDYGKTPEVEAGKVVRGMFACVLPGLMSFLCGFYCMLHAWFNAFAELLTFADRLFYEDWWTTSRFSTFYRAWNRVVHAWLLDHVHAPLASALGRSLSGFAVFLLSAAVHEVILALSYGFFYPVLTVMFVGSACVFIPFTSSLGKRYPHTFNFLVWLSFFIGNGLLWSLYPMEYFARLNCPALPTDSFFVPKSWSCPTLTLKPDWQFQNPLKMLF